MQASGRCQPAGSKFKGGNRNSTDDWRIFRSGCEAAHRSPGRPRRATLGTARRFRRILMRLKTCTTFAPTWETAPDPIVSGTNTAAWNELHSLVHRQTSIDALDCDCGAAVSMFSRPILQSCPPLLWWDSCSNIRILFTNQVLRQRLEQPALLLVRWSQRRRIQTFVRFPHSNRRIASQPRSQDSRLRTHILKAPFSECEAELRDKRFPSGSLGTSVAVAVRKAGWPLEFRLIGHDSCASLTLIVPPESAAI